MTTRPVAVLLVGGLHIDEPAASELADIALHEGRIERPADAGLQLIENLRGGNGAVADDADFGDGLIGGGERRAADRRRGSFFLPNIEFGMLGNPPPPPPPPLPPYWPIAGVGSITAAATGAARATNRQFGKAHIVKMVLNKVVCLRSEIGGRDEIVRRGDAWRGLVERVGRGPVWSAVRPQRGR